jgi:hypothetical protein
VSSLTVLHIDVIPLLQLCQAATAAEAGDSPSGPLPSHSGSGAAGQELRSASDGRSGELRAVSASASDAMSGMHSGYGGCGDGSMAVGSSMASLYPGGSVRSASGRLLPAGDGGAGVQVSVILLRGMKSTWCQSAGFALLPGRVKLASGPQSSAHFAAVPSYSVYLAP